MDANESLLRAIFMTLGRSTFPPETLYRIVAPQGTGKSLVAYNLCDGHTPQADIANKAKLDKGNLSRALARWIEAGIVVRVGKDQLPLHVYPLSQSAFKGK